VTPLRILRLAAGGDGVGKLEDGRTVFVPRTAPGDLIEVTRVKEQKRFARARLSRVLEPSPNRVQPRCPHYERDECGGCQLQHLDNETQLESRRSFVGDALRRIGKRDVTDPAIVSTPLTYDYRTKLTLHAAARGRIGLHRYDRPDQVFDLDWCHITVPALMHLWQAVKRNRNQFPSQLQQLVLRLDRRGRCHLVLKLGEGEVWTGADRLHRELARQGISATIWYQPPDGAARAVAGAEEAFPATVFEQVNPQMGDKVREFAVQQLADIRGQRIWDLYAGIGETTAQLVERGAQVESVELDRRAVAEAEARGPVARRLAGRVEDVVSQLKSPDGVITNPPRVGMHELVTAHLERVRPARLVYISCDPATLARDLQRLRHFELTSVQAFDLFPQTTHVETVAVLTPA